MRPCWLVCAAAFIPLGSPWQLWGCFTVRGVTRLLSAVLTLAVLGALTGCGEDESDLIGEDSLRECLADAGLGPDRPANEGATGYAPLYLSTAPDFSAYSEEGVQLDVVVQGSEEKAARTAADVRGAMLPLGIPDAGERVLVGRNVVAVFAESPSAADIDAAGSCLE
jgi:hypothetical protein